MRYTVQQDCAGWVVVSEGTPRRAVSHHKRREDAMRHAAGLNREYPAVLIEVPHQRPAKSYIAVDEETLIRICEASVGNAYPWPEVPTVDDYLEAFGHDMNHAVVMFGRNEVLERLDADNSGEHQGARVNALIHEAAVTLGWVRS